MKNGTKGMVKPGGNFAPPPSGYIWQHAERCSGLSQDGAGGVGGVLLPPDEQEPGALQGTLQCMGEAPTLKTCVARNTSSAELEKSWIDR